MAFKFGFKFGNKKAKKEVGFFSLSKSDPQAMRELQSIMWQSTANYSWQDFGSACGVFSSGLNCLEALRGGEYMPLSNAPEDADDETGAV
ncbi:MAG: hypothetical protein LBT59_20490 [Clostridiales bacterium]|jgi:hypothetical protein|nr:hypothetical protein [Clostridiales bacterium]